MIGSQKGSEVLQQMAQSWVMFVNGAIHGYRHMIPTHVF